MNTGARSVRKALFARERRQLDSICPACRIQLRLASTATATAPAPASSSPTPAPSRSSPPVPKPAYRILASVVVSRPPLITRSLHPFEKAYHLYNRRLNERLALPFTRYFYYKKGTPQDGEWKRKVRARLTAARDIGVYSAYSKEGWNDEVLVGDETGGFEQTIGEVYRDAEGFTEDAIRGKMITGDGVGSADPQTEEVVAGERKPSSGEIEARETLGAQDPKARDGLEALEAASEGEKSKSQRGTLPGDSTGGPQDGLSVNAGEELQELGPTGAVIKEGLPRPAPRITEADKKGDVKSLSRKLDRTLYLLVKSAGGEWVFPSDLLKGKEGLHQAAERVLVQAGGINMNTWVVGNAPIGWRRDEQVKPTMDEGKNVEEFGAKTFFMKARIMTGQIDMGKNILGDTDFQWLAKEEIQGVVNQNYYASIKNMLVER